MEFEGEDDFDDSPKIQTIFKIESSFIKEWFIFINFLCANLLFVYIILYPIKRLVQGLSIIERLIKSKFKTSIILYSIYVFIYIVLSVFINLVSKFKLRIFSEKWMMNSVINEIIENNKKKNIINEVYRNN